MTGSALADFIIVLIVLGGAAALFFAVIDGIAPNALFAKIAKIAVGVAVAVAFVLAVKSVLFGGGGLAVSPIGLFYFAIGILVVLVVLYLAKLFLHYVLPDWLNEPVMFVLGALCLIALMYLAANQLFGVGPRIGSLGGTMPQQHSIIR